MSLGLGGNQDVDACYDGLPSKGISSYEVSYLQPIEAFYDQWDPNVKEEILKIMNMHQKIFVELKVKFLQKMKTKKP